MHIRDDVQILLTAVVYQFLSSAVSDRLGSHGSLCSSALQDDSLSPVDKLCRCDHAQMLVISRYARMNLVCVCYSILISVCMPQDELYSSRIRDFAVFGRQSHPRAEGPDYGSHLNASSWQLLGRFTAANTKGTQVQHSTPVFLLYACLFRPCPNTAHASFC